MRTLTSPMIAAANADSGSPYCLLQISFPAPIGNRWYAQEDFGAGDGSSWDNAQGRVLEWGTVRVEIKADKAVNVVGDCTIRLRDEDKVLWNYFQQIEPQRSFVKIWTQFRGLSESDMVQVHAGIVNAPCAWSEKDHAVSLDVTDISTYFNHTVGNLADRLDYPNVVQTDENKMIPLVFGSVKRVPAVALDFGPVTSLARQVAFQDMGLYVVDAEKFPQEIPTEIWINGERISGKFIGNFFSVSQRGGPIYTGSVTTAPPTQIINDISVPVNPQQLIDSGLTGGDGQWCGFTLEVTTPDGKTQRLLITGYDASTHTLTFGMTSGHWYTDPMISGSAPQWIGNAFSNDGSVYALPLDAAYQIVTPVETHSTGEKVYLARPSYTYVVNDAPSKAVYVVEGYGHPIIDTNWTANGPVSSYAPTEWYCVLSPTAYSINRNDTTTCPGRAVTSISFLIPPSQFDTRLNNDDLWVTLDGVETAGDGTGDLISNPADVIQCIHTRFMGMPSGNIDADSFAAAKTATAPLVMGFALREQKNGLELCADLAFQARCSEVFFAGQAQLIFLTNVMVPAGTPPTTGRARYLGSLDIARRDWNQIVTEVTGSYLDNALRQTVIVRSPAAEAFVGGRRAKTIDFWAYATLPPVQGVARFWLNRWQYIWQQIALVESLRRLDAEPYDLFDLDLPGWFGADQVSRIIGIEQTLGGGSDRKIPGIRLSAEIPYFPADACDTLAEAMPPPGCWACETSCQVGCELFCTTQFMLNQVQTDAAPTAAPETEEPTEAPEETTEAPGGTTAAPAGTTAAPGATTAAPAGTTPGPEETTEAPEETTEAPEETTEEGGTAGPTEAPEPGFDSPSGDGYTWNPITGRWESNDGMWYWDPSLGIWVATGATTHLPTTPAPTTAAPLPSQLCLVVTGNPVVDTTGTTIGLTGPAAYGGGLLQPSGVSNPWTVWWNGSQWAAAAGPGYTYLGPTNPSDPAGTYVLTGSPIVITVTVGACPT